MMTRAFGDRGSRAAQLQPRINGQAFCGAATAPHWHAWQQQTVGAIQHGLAQDAEEAALNLIANEGHLPAQRLPAYCYWECRERLPVYDARCSRFVEYFVPHEAIGVMGGASSFGAREFIIEYRDGRICPMSVSFIAHRPGGEGGLKLRDVPGAGVGEDYAHLVVDGGFKPVFLENLFEQLSAEYQVQFVQMGAMDGISHDPLHDAVKRYGWKGVLAEPLPDMYERLRATYAGCEQLSFEMAAVTDACGRCMMYRVDVNAAECGVVPEWALGISSLHRDRNALGGKRISAEDHGKISAHMIEEEVETITFDELVRRYQIESINVLQIDTEGSDYTILRQVDLKRFRPDIIQLEFCNIPDDEKEQSLLILRSHGYSCYISVGGTDLLAVSKVALGLIEQCNTDDEEEGQEA